MVYVLNVNGEPIMPTNRYRHVRKLLKSKRAKIVGYEPFTIQLLYEVENKTQDIDLKVDSGYLHVGLSSCSDNTELYSAELEMYAEQKERMDTRRKYRRTRRNRLRYRKPRFDNRRRSEGWLAPSIEYKVETHLKQIKRVTDILPITKIIVEVANFDIHALKNPDINGAEYQQGEMFDFRNLREYTFFRDNYTCQICGKSTFKDGAVLRMHHVEYWNNSNRSNIPANTLTVCTKCHSPKNHEPTGKLYGIEMKHKPFKAETFMATVRWIILNRLKERYKNINVVHSYGYQTKDKRIELGLDKTHYNDAYCIGDKQPKKRLANTLILKQQRKNNRSLEKFYDAKYIDRRDGTKKTGKELFSGRTTRNTNLNSENLHQYRGQKLSKGRRAIRKQHYMYQPNDIVKYNNRTYKVKGTHCNGSRVLLQSEPKAISIAINKLEPYKFSKTIYLEREVKAG